MTSCCSLLGTLTRKGDARPLVKVPEVLKQDSHTVLSTERQKGSRLDAQGMFGKEPQ